MLINVFLSSELTPFLVRFYSFFLCVIFVNGFIQRERALCGAGYKHRTSGVEDNFNYLKSSGRGFQPRIAQNPCYMPFF
jgi:hypothetical protein